MSENKKIFYALLILSTALFVLRLPTLFELPYHDQTAYAYFGRMMAEGQLLYQDLWDHHPPGMFLFYQGIFYLGGGQHWVIPFVDLLFTLLIVGAIFLLAKSFWGAGTALGAAFISALFALSPAYQNCWSRNQPEVLINFLQVLCIYFGYQSFCHQKLWSCFISGLTLGVAFIIKYTALFLIAPLMPLLWVSPLNVTSFKHFRLKKFSLLIFGGLIPVVATILYLYAKGVLSKAYEALILFIPIYAQMEVDKKFFFSIILDILQGQIIFSSAILLLALLGLWRERLYRSLRGQILLLWILGGLASVLIQGKYIWNHFFFIIPPLSLLAGFAVGWVTKKNESRAAFAFSLIVIILSTVALGDAFKGYFRDYKPGFASLLKKDNYEQALRSLPMNENKLGSWELGKFIAQNSQKTDYIGDWIYGPEVYYFAGRPAANRYIFHHFLVDSRNPWSKKIPDVKARQQEYMKNLREKSVKFFVIFIYGNNNLPLIEAFQRSKDFPELDQFLNNNYFVAMQNNQFMLLQRK